MIELEKLEPTHILRDMMKDRGKVGISSGIYRIFHNIYVNAVLEDGRPSFRIN
jgi:hypothetical protein